MTACTSSTTRSLALAALLFASLFTAAPAYAANLSFGYISLQGTVSAIDSNAPSRFNDDAQGGFRLKFGKTVSRFFDVEAQFGAAVNNRNRSFRSSDELLVRYAGVYLKGHLPVGSRSSLFALTGYSTVNIREDFGRREFGENRLEFEETNAGFSFGFGGQIQVSRRLDFSADVVTYTQDFDQFDDVTTFNFGLEYYF